MNFEAHYPDGSSEVLLHVPGFDFSWQTVYYYRDLKRLPKGTRVEYTAWYDNSEENLSNPDPSKEISWGPQSWDEMMIGFYDFGIPIEIAGKLAREGTSQEVGEL